MGADYSTVSCLRLSGVVSLRAMATESKDDVDTTTVPAAASTAAPVVVSAPAVVSAPPVVAAPEVPSDGVLYARYAPLAAVRDSADAMDPDAYLAALHATTSAPATTTTGTAAAAAPAAAVEAAARLAAWGMCRTCGGDGVERTMYNHMVMQRTCRTCGGDGVVGPPPAPSAPAPASTSASTTAGAAAAPAPAAASADTDGVPPLE